MRARLKWPGHGSLNELGVVFGNAAQGGTLTFHLRWSRWKRFGWNPRPDIYAFFIGPITIARWQSDCDVAV